MPRSASIHPMRTFLAEEDISVFIIADQSITLISDEVASLFSTPKQWRSSKFGLSVNLERLLADTDSIRLIAARPWQIDRGQLDVRVPVGREFDGTANYDARTLSLANRTQGLELTVQYRYSGAGLAYGLDVSFTDHDLNLNDEPELRASGALAYRF